MKLLWLTSKFPPNKGGSENYLYSYIKNMVHTESTIICRPDSIDSCKDIDNCLASTGNNVIRSDMIPDNLAVMSLIYSFLKIIKTYCISKKIINEKDIDLVIFGNYSFFHLYVMIILKIMQIKVPVAFIFYGEDIPIPEFKMKSNFIKCYLSRFINLHICISNYAFNRLVNFSGYINNPAIAFPGVEDRYFNAVDTTSLREKYDLKDKSILLTVGRLDPRKGHDLVIASLPKIIEAMPNVIYLIGGNGHNLEFLKSKVTDLGLHNYVKFCGLIADEDIVAFFQLCDIFVMPNRILEDGDTEGFGIVFLEANACGKPVIGGACGGAPDAIQNGVTGYLVDPYATDELTEKIVYLLSNHEKASEMGKCGRQRAWDFFRWSYLASNLESCLKKFVE